MSTQSRKSTVMSQKFDLLFLLGKVSNENKYNVNCKHEIFSTNIAKKQGKTITILKFKT